MELIHQYALEGLDLENKTILDAATGIGKSTRAWAEAIHAGGGTSRILSIDNDLSSDWKKRITAYLGKYSRYVELREADIFDLSFLQDASIDIVNCADTLLFLNPVPLRVLSAIAQFQRVLKQGGHLVITSELPLGTEQQNEGQWLRWTLSKAVQALKGKVWATEIELRDLVSALEMTGFTVQNSRTFAETRRTAPESEAVINEWHEVVCQEIMTLEWAAMKPVLNKAADDVRRKVLDAGYILCPAKIVVKCVKKSRMQAESSVSLAPCASSSGR